MSTSPNQEEIQKQSFVVTEKDAGCRLDLWLVKQLSLSRKKIKQCIDAGAVSINQKPVIIAGWKLEQGQRVTIGGQKKEAPWIHILYEDRDLIVVDKPAGLHVMDPPQGSLPTLYDGVMAYLRRKYAHSSGSRVFLVHRLDRETSGVTVFAKSKDGEMLREDFRRHRIRREYIALVEGDVPQKQGTIDLRLERGTFSGGKKMQRGRGARAKHAKTSYRVLERFGNATLLTVSVETGRTHQIRVHFSEMGHPLVGEKIYGGTMRFPRHALHAECIELRHPASKKKMCFRAPLPRDLTGLLEKLRSGR